MGLGNEKTFNYADYFNTNELSSVTFEYTSDLTLTVNEGVLTLNTTGLELGEYTVTLKALYKGEVKQTVELAVEVIAEEREVEPEAVEEPAEKIEFFQNYCS